MSKKNPYKNFSSYILRTPLLSFSWYQKLTSKKNVSDSDFKKIYTDPIIKEAIFLASPSLYEEMMRALNGEMTDKKKEKKLQLSIFKYLSRMSSRCTPFGLFAGCAVGKFDESTEINLIGAAKNKRHTRLDMNYLVALSQDLVKNLKIREQLTFFPNSSIYLAGDQLRYVEYEYVNSKRQHLIVAVDNTEYLSKVLKKASKGALLKDLAALLVDDEITLEEATEFIEQLVSNQLLISELEPSVSGPEFLHQIRSVLKKINHTQDILTSLEETEKKIVAIDKKIGNDPQKYLTLSEELKSLETTFELKFMFQTDMILQHKKNTISKELITSLQKGLLLLNKISLPAKTSLLTNFKDAFLERFEEREVSLSKALDIEIGIGYKQDLGAGDINPLVDNIAIPPKPSKHSEMDVKWSSVNAFFQKKLIQAYKENAYTITLDDADFKDYEVTWDDLPDTISCMVEIIEEKGLEKIKFNGGGGSSAANLLGRFCHGDTEIHTLVNEMIDVETQINNDKILAEIVHLPESRVGNILMRPDIRAYEIPYLARSVKSVENQLPLDDLMVSVKNHSKILVRSKKYNKEIIPHLTNAHNYSNNSLPIYHFLSDMQTQNIRGGIGFGFGPFANDYEFLPRVEYLNIIIHDATWNLKKSHIEPLLENSKDDTAFYKAIKTFRKTLNIPQYVMLADGDNELLVNFDNLTSVQMFLQTINKRDQFKLTEFLFGESGTVKSGGEYYTNQVIVSFYNEEKLNNSKKNDE